MIVALEGGRHAILRVEYYAPGCFRVISREEITESQFEAVATIWNRRPHGAPIGNRNAARKSP